MRHSHLARTAVRAVFQNGLRTALTMLGLVIGISSVIVLVGIGDGSNQQVHGKMKELGGDAISAYLYQGELGYDDLTFLTGDIADYESTGADMVVTLHACDTATDYALINAVKWHSRVILSVPCCQHELFSQIKEPVNDSYLKYGILKDKFTEILTDGLRGLKLESAGYQVNMIEFTSLEHTARNVMIKAVLPDPAALTEKQRQKQEAAKEKASQEYEALKNMYHVHPTIDQL